MAKLIAFIFIVGLVSCSEGEVRERRQATGISTANTFNSIILEPSLSAIFAKYPLGLPPPATVKRHVTWSRLNRLPAYGVDVAGCGGECNPYLGDTPCTSSLPVLCVAQIGVARPVYDCPTAGGLMPKEFYCGWAEGGFKVTSTSYLGTNLLSQTNMDNICKSQFGVAYRAAEHHMGRYKIGMSSTQYNFGTWWFLSPTTYNGGWNLYAYGDLPATTQRYWVVVNDQPAHCWN